MAATIWNLGIGCLTLLLFQLASVVAAIRVQQLYSQTRPRYQLFCFFAAITNQELTHGVVPKTKATLQESFGLDMDGTELLVGWKKGCPYLCYIVLKPEDRQTSGCLLCLNWICNLSFSPQGIVHGLLVFSGDSSTLEPFPPTSN